jgi:acyl carrier protein
MHKHEVATSLRTFITNHFPHARKRRLEDVESLLESGIVDSLGVLDIVAFLESEFGVRADDDDLVPENFSNIARIADYVLRKKNGTF